MYGHLSEDFKNHYENEGEYSAQLKNTAHVLEGKIQFMTKYYRSQVAGFNYQLYFLH